MHPIEVGPAHVAWALTSNRHHGARHDVTDLSAVDQARAAGFAPDRRREFVVGRSLVHDLVVGLFPDASGWSIGTGLCLRCGQHHGPVQITGLPAVAGLSYAGELVVAAVAPMRLASRLGVDVEVDAVGTARKRDLERLLGRSHQPLPRRWTRIEAVLKADGRGLRVEPADVRVRGAEATVADASPRYRVADVAGPSGYAISLAWCDAGSSAASCDPASG